MEGGTREVWYMQTVAEDNYEKGGELILLRAAEAPYSATQHSFIHCWLIHFPLECQL